MKIEKVAKIKGGQDGAIYGSELFRFTPSGECYVYDMRKLVGGAEVVSAEPIAKFKLDRSDEIAPHSNAVSFGCEFFEEGDEYPLLYTNIYNNYANSEDKMIGVCLVYRIRRCENVFTSTLLQMIEIGFCEDTELWRASAESHGKRPYGNFLVASRKRIEPISPTMITFRRFCRLSPSKVRT